MKYVIKRRYMNEGVWATTIISSVLNEMDAKRQLKALTSDYQSTQYFIDVWNP